VAALTISMIPTGQPYGQRQATEAATQEAGLPVTASQAPPQVGPPPMLSQLLKDSGFAPSVGRAVISVMA